MKKIFLTVAVAITAMFSFGCSLEQAEQAVGSSSSFITYFFRDGTDLIMSDGLTDICQSDGTTCVTVAPGGGGATMALDNLASVAINESLVSDTALTDDLGTEAIPWLKGWFGSSLSFEGSTDDDFQTTITFTDPTTPDKTITFPDLTGTVGLSTNKLSFFSATSSAELAGVLSDETGSGLAVFGTSPNITTPTGIIASDITVGEIGTSTLDDVQDFVRVDGSAGLVTGGIITDSTGAEIDVSAGTGYIRTTDLHDATLLSFDWAGITNLAIPTDTTRYIGIEYNAGTPQIVARSSDNFDIHDEFRFGSVVNEGDVLHILTNPQIIVNNPSHIWERFFETNPFEWAERLGGCAVGETGTRNLTVTACEFYDGYTEFDLTTKDTSGADNFDTYCTTTKEASGSSAWDNANYCNAGTLTALTSNRYANLFIYAELDDDLIIVYGNAQYSTIAGAEMEGAPATVPDRVSIHSTLIARLTFQEGGATANEIVSTLIDPIGGTAVSDHGNLSGLADDDHAQYILVDGTRAFTGNQALGDKNLTGMGSASFTQELDGGSETGAFSVDFSTDQKQKTTLTANVITLTLDTTDIGVGNYLLKIVNGGLATLTWAGESGSVFFPGGTDPVLTASGTDIVTFYFDGTNFYGVGTLDFQ